jgi:hypothetical protein
MGVCVDCQDNLTRASQTSHDGVTKSAPSHALPPPGRLSAPASPAPPPTAPSAQYPGLSVIRPHRLAAARRCGECAALGARLFLGWRVRALRPDQAAQGSAEISECGACEKPAPLHHARPAVASPVPAAQSNRRCCAFVPRLRSWRRRRGAAASENLICLPHPPPPPSPTARSQVEQGVVSYRTRCSARTYPMPSMAYSVTVGPLGSRKGRAHGEVPPPAGTRRLRDQPRVPRARLRSLP